MEDTTNAEKDLRPRPDAVSPEDQSPTPLPLSEVKQSTTKNWRFWAVFPPLCIVSWLAALEATAVSTALPSITKELDAGDLYIWFVNGYFLTL